MRVAISVRNSHDVQGKLVKANSKQRIYRIFGREFQINKWEYRLELFYGLLSGYSRCCIEVYIRKSLLIQYKSSFDPDASKFRELWLKIKTALKKDKFQKRFGHVLCGKCYEKYQAVDFRPIY